MVRMTTFRQRANRVKSVLLVVARNHLAGAAGRPAARDGGRVRDHRRAAPRPQTGWHTYEVLTAAFVAAERRSAHPMIPPSLLANPMLRAAVTTRFLLFATILGSAFMVPQD